MRRSEIREERALDDVGRNAACGSDLRDDRSTS
jgi:hypothetical protein